MKASPSPASPAASMPPPASHDTPPICPTLIAPAAAWAFGPGSTRPRGGMGWGEGVGWGMVVWVGVWGWQVSPPSRGAAAPDWIILDKVWPGGYLEGEVG